MQLPSNYSYLGETVAFEWDSRGIRIENIVWNSGRDFPRMPPSQKLSSDDRVVGESDLETR